jgi:hypothetical protein
LMAQTGTTPSQSANTSMTSTVTSATLSPSTAHRPTTWSPKYASCISWLVTVAAALCLLTKGRCWCGQELSACTIASCARAGSCLPMLTVL